MPDTVGSKNTRDRVNIKADVETAKGKVKVKVPFVMGVMSELSGASADQLPPVEDRQLMDFNQQNFGKRMESIAPTVRCEVADRIGGEKGATLPVELKFRSMHDFTPGAVARQVEPLRKLLLVRNKLKEILANAQGHADREKAVMALLTKLKDDPAAQAFAESVGEIVSTSGCHGLVRQAVPMLRPEARLGVPNHGTRRTGKTAPPRSASPATAPPPS